MTAATSESCGAMMSTGAFSSPPSVRQKSILNASTNVESGLDVSTPGPSVAAGRHGNEPRPLSESRYSMPWENESSQSYPLEPQRLGVRSPETLRAFALRACRASCERDRAGDEPRFWFRRTPRGEPRSVPRSPTVAALRTPGRRLSRPEGRETWASTGSHNVLRVPLPHRR
jgi:hypothetical protein